MLDEELLTFTFQDCKMWSCLLFGELVAMSMTPETIILDFGYTKLLKIIQEKSRSIWGKFYSWKSQNLNKPTIRKRRVPEIA